MTEGEGISQRTFMHNSVCTDNSVVIPRGKGARVGWEWWAKGEKMGTSVIMPTMKLKNISLKQCLL